MADRIITAEALITAKDGTGDVFERVAKKLQGIGKSAKASAEIEKMNAALERQKSQLAALDKMQAARTKFSDARAQFMAQKVAVEQAARAMKEAEAPTRALEGAYKRAQAAVSRASAEFDKQKAAMLDAKHAAESFGSPLAKIASEQARLRESIESTTAAIERQARAERRAAAAHEAAAKVAHRIKHAVHEVSPLVMGGTGFETLEATKEATKAGAEIQHERARLKVAGVPDDEIARADAQAAQLAAKYPNVTRAQILENYKEVRSVLQDKSEAPEMMPTLIQARSAMTALDPTGGSAEGLRFAIKGAELLNKAKDPAKFRDYLDGFIRAQQVMGTTANPEQLGDFAKYTRSSGGLLSDRFLHTTANSLIQEEKGSTAGKMVADVVKEMTGGFEGSHAAAKQLVDLGLANKDDFNVNKNGDLKGLKPGKHIKDWKKWQSDPDRAVWEDLVPAMEKKGMDLQTQIATVRRLFPNSLAADFVAKLIAQRQSFENHSKLYGEASGIDGGKQLAATDPIAAFGSLSKSIENLGATLTSPIMEKAAGVMDQLAHSIGGFAASLADWQKAHPDAAKWAAGGAIGGGLVAGGALGYGAYSTLAGGFGLDASATALDGSAAALTQAAAAIEAASGKGALAAGASGAATTSEAAAGEAEGAAAGATLAGRAKGLLKTGARVLPQVVLYDIGTQAIDTGLDFLPHPQYPPGYDPQAKLNESPIERIEDIAREIVPALQSLKNAIIPSAHAEPAPRPAMSPYGGLGGAKTAFATPHPASFEPHPAMGDPHPAFQPPSSPSGGGSALKGPVTATVQQPIPVDVTGKVQLQGQASVSISVKCEGGEVTKQIASSSGNIKVSTGASMPGAKTAAAGSTGTK